MAAILSRGRWDNDLFFSTGSDAIIQDSEQDHIDGLVQERR